MFDGYLFMFPIQSIGFSKTKLEVIAGLIEVNGGRTKFTLEEFINGMESQKSLFIVGSDALFIDCENITSKVKIPFQKHLFIKSEFISSSISKKQIQAPEAFRQFPEIHLQFEKPSPPKQKFQYLDSIAKVVPKYDQEEEEISADVFQEEQPKRKINFRKNRDLIDYNYDPTYELYHSNSDDDYEQEIKQEEVEIKQEIGDKYIEDPDCQIIQPPESHLLDDLAPQIVVDDPLLSAQMINPHVFNPSLRRKQAYWDKQKDHFACEAGSSNSNYNQLIIDELDRLLKIYTNEKDKGRCIAYRKAIAHIKSLKFVIKSEEDVRNIPSIGEKIRLKIQEIIQTGKLSKAEKLESTDKNKSIAQLSRVWGIGATTATTFFFKGIKTIEDLKKNQQLLTRQQQIGLKYLTEFEERIPRDEVTRIVQIIKNKIDELSDINGVYDVICCGSYRRLKDICGDVDILLTRRDGKHDPGFLLKVVENLPLLTDHLVLPKLGSHGSESYMGVGIIDKIHRRIDLKYYPRDQFGYAVLYFTGSDHFNRSMRLFAQKKGYSLTDHGLYPTLRAKGNQKVWRGDCIPCYSEREVFNLLGLTYKDPQDRSL